MIKTQRVAIVGCGAHMQTVLLPAMTQAGILPAAACDPDVQRAATVSELYGVPAFGSLEEALSTVSCAGAVIAVSREENGRLAETCISRGLPAFVDKPPAASAADATRLAGAARDTKVLVQVGLMKRFGPAYVRARRIASGPEFGGPRIVSVQAAAGSYSCLSDLCHDYGIHYADLCLQFGGPAASVTAVCPSPAAPPAISAVITFSSGAIGTLVLTTSGGWHEPSERVIIHGGRMRIEIDNVVCLRWFRGEPEAGAGPDDGGALTFEPNFHLPASDASSLTLQGYAGQFRQFRVSLATGFPTPVTMDTGAAAMQLVEAILRAAESGEVTAV